MFLWSRSEITILFRSDKIRLGFVSNTPTMTNETESQSVFSLEEFITHCCSCGQRWSNCSNACDPLDCQLRAQQFWKRLTQPTRMSREHFFERVYLEAAAVASLKANEELKSKQMKRSAEKKLLHELDNVIHVLKGPSELYLNQWKTQILPHRSLNWFLSLSVH